MNQKEIIAMLEDARMRYAEAQVRRLHIAEEKQRYANLLISYAPELLKAAAAAADMEEAACAAKPLTEAEPTTSRGRKKA